MNTLEFIFSSFWVYWGVTFWLLLLVVAASSFTPIVIQHKDDHSDHSATWEKDDVH